jgi:hypothetical protein
MSDSKHVALVGQFQIAEFSLSWREVFSKTPIDSDLNEVFGARRAGKTQVTSSGSAS